MDLEEFDFVIEYFKGRENVVADALSRISIKDLFKIYEDNHTFKTEITQYEHKCSKTRQKHERFRNYNTVLAFTRSMAQAQKSKQIQNETSNIENIISDHSIYESFAQNKKNPRVRITNCILDNTGIPMKITLCIFKNHRKIELDNEKVTLNKLLSPLQRETSTLNITKLEWPIHDKIFKICTITDFKNAANKILNKLKIRLIQSPAIINDKQTIQNIINKFHSDDLYGGHYGKKKMFAKLKDQYYWRHMTRDI